MVRERFQSVRETTSSTAEGRMTSSETNKRLDIIEGAQCSIDIDTKVSRGRVLCTQIMSRLLLEEG